LHSGGKQKTHLRFSGTSLSLRQRAAESVLPQNDWRCEPFSNRLHCPHCNLSYRDPVPNLFSFNSPLGACETCRGFGRVIDIDLDLVIPDPGKVAHGRRHQAVD